MIPISGFLLKRSPARCSGITAFNGAQVLTAAPRALAGCAHSGKDVLFHQNVAVVADRLQAAQQRRIIHTPFAQLAKQSAAKRLKVVPLRSEEHTSELQSPC